MTKQPNTKTQKKCIHDWTVAIGGGERKNIGDPYVVIVIVCRKCRELIKHYVA